MLLGQMVYGMSVYEMVRDLNRERACLSGCSSWLCSATCWACRFYLPITPCACCPYVVPSIESWRYSMLRERDMTGFMR